MKKIALSNLKTMGQLYHVDPRGFVTASEELQPWRLVHIVQFELAQLYLERCKRVEGRGNALVSDELADYIAREARQPIAHGVALLAAIVAGVARWSMKQNHVLYSPRSQTIGVSRRWAQASSVEAAKQVQFDPSAFPALTGERRGRKGLPNGGRDGYRERR